MIASNETQAEPDDGVEQPKMRLIFLRFVAKNMAESRLCGKLELAASPSFVAALKPMPAPEPPSGRPHLGGHLGLEKPACR